MANKKISELTNNNNPGLSAITPVVVNNITYKTSLQNLRQLLVDNGSHVFTGSQVINGNLIISGSLTAQEYIISSSIINIVTENISGSTSFGNTEDDTHSFTGSVSIQGPLNVNGVGNMTNLIVGIGELNESNPEVLHAESDGSFNIAHYQGNFASYTQVNLKNINDGNGASGDIVITADNGTEEIHYVDLGINSSTYNAGYVGYENDAYLLNAGKDLYLGTIGGIEEHPAKVHIFTNNSWEDSQIVIHPSKQIGFNTGSVTTGYTYEFSGSVKMNNDLLVDGILNIGGVNEKVSLHVGGGVTTHEFDYNSGSVFYLTGSLGDNVYNVSNVPTINQTSISLTFVIKQEGVSYIATSYTFNNEPIDIIWSNNNQPTGSSEKTDVIDLRAFRFDSSWNVLGTYTTFG